MKNRREGTDTRVENDIGNNSTETYLSSGAIEDQRIPSSFASPSFSPPLSVSPSLSLSFFIFFPSGMRNARRPFTRPLSIIHLLIYNIAVLCCILEYCFKINQSIYLNDKHEYISGTFSHFILDTLKRSLNFIFLLV